MWTGKDDKNFSLRIKVTTGACPDKSFDGRQRRNTKTKFSTISFNNWFGNLL